jgi:hypothetical protein
MPGGTRDDGSRQTEIQHDFREWCGALDWIVQNVFNLPPLLEGHRAEQERLSSPGLLFLRDVCHLVTEGGMCGELLSARDLADIFDVSGRVVPGCQRGADRQQLAQRIGSTLGPLFKDFRRNRDRRV